VVDFALQALSCDYAGVALRAAGGRPEVPAVTDPVVAEIYQFQMAGADDTNTKLHDVAQQLIDSRRLPKV
jgi:hypothetical protein